MPSITRRSLLKFAAIGGASSVQTGLDVHLASDLCQDVLVIVFQKTGNFQYDPSGSFRNAYRDALDPLPKVLLAPYFNFFHLPDQDVIRDMLGIGKKMGVWKSAVVREYCRRRSV